MTPHPLPLPSESAPIPPSMRRQSGVVVIACRDVVHCWNESETAAPAWTAQWIRVLPMAVGPVPGLSSTSTEGQGI